MTSEALSVDELLAPGLDLAALADRFAGAEPFEHVVIDGFLRPGLARELADVFPGSDAPFWYRYASPLERKLAYNKPDHTPPAIWSVLTALSSDAMVARLRALTGIAGLVADPSLHGGGMHCIGRDGKLDLHVDYAVHPVLGLERRLNLILYLNADWRPEWGGELELWDAEVARCQARIAPLLDRAVLFATGDRSVHGHPEPLRCPPGVARKSLALYYVAPKRAATSERRRARFLARPTDPPDPALDELRQKRADEATVTKVYRTDDD